MRQTAETITQMTSVERILQFTELEKEGPFESNPTDKPSSNWPAKGEIKFDRVSLRYAESEPPVLKSLSFVIEPGMKVITQLFISNQMSHLLQTIILLVYNILQVILNLRYSKSF